jgi:hypothetical protein
MTVARLIPGDDAAAIVESVGATADHDMKDLPQPTHKDGLTTAVQILHKSPISESRSTVARRRADGRRKGDRRP